MAAQAAEAKRLSFPEPSLDAAGASSASGSARSSRHPRRPSGMVARQSKHRKNVSAPHSRVPNGQIRRHPARTLDLTVATDNEPQFSRVSHLQVETGYPTEAVRLAPRNVSGPDPAAKPSLPALPIRSSQIWRRGWPPHPAWNPDDFNFLCAFHASQGRVFSRIADSMARRPFRCRPQRTPRLTAPPRRHMLQHMPCPRR